MTLSAREKTIAVRSLTSHQRDVLRDYQQLGTLAAVADFRGVQVATINNTLGIVRDKLGVKTTREAIQKAQEVAHG